MRHTCCRSYRYSHFFHLGVAHCFLLGLLMDFWNVWLPPAKKVAQKKGARLGSRFVMPAHVRAAISARTDDILVTELFGKPYTDITRCGCWCCFLGTVLVSCKPVHC